MRSIPIIDPNWQDTARIAVLELSLQNVKLPA